VCVCVRWRWVPFALVLTSFTVRRRRALEREKKKNKRDCDHAVHTLVSYFFLVRSCLHPFLPPSVVLSLITVAYIFIVCVCTVLLLSLLSFLVVVVAVLWDDDKSQDKKYETRRSLSLSQMMMTSKGGKTAVTFRLLLAFALVVKGHTQTQVGHISISLFLSPLSSLLFLRLLLFPSDFLLVYVRAHTHRAREPLPFSIDRRGRTGQKETG